MTKITDKELEERIGKSFLRLIKRLEKGGVFSWIYIQDEESTNESIVLTVEAFEKAINESLKLN